MVLITVENTLKHSFQGLSD